LRKHSGIFYVSFCCFKNHQNLIPQFLASYVSKVNPVEITREEEKKQQLAEVGLRKALALELDLISGDFLSDVDLQEFHQRNFKN